MFLDIRHRRCPQFLFFFDFAKKWNIILFLFKAILHSSARADWNNT